MLNSSIYQAHSQGRKKNRLEKISYGWCSHCLEGGNHSRSVDWIVLPDNQS